MSRIAIACGLAVLVYAEGALAQGAIIDSQCRSGSSVERATQDACQKTVDIFAFMAPQLSASLIGGSAVLGEVRSLGGFGHLSLGIRGNVMRARLPDVDAIVPDVTGARSNKFAVEDKPLGLPVVDLAVGILPGVDLGDVSILGIDALVNVAWIPEVTEGDLTVRLPDGSLKLGLGARVTVIEESAFGPSIALSFLQRDLPRIDIHATPGSDELRVSQLTLTSDAWRAAVGKSLGPLQVSIGAGKDRFDASATIDVNVNRAGHSYQRGDVLVAQSMRRQTVFADLALNLSALRIVAEVGQVSGGSVVTYNTFDGKRADDSLQFGSLGVRVRW
ncbi:MAG: hypothetical protein MNPFHGCM_01589 [Gemmatimonadaceae bacterium]|nr:hypothetical protein [Gemmatimonadaceae bacterium]